MTTHLYRQVPDSEQVSVSVGHNVWPYMRQRVMSYAEAKKILERPVDLMKGMEDCQIHAVSIVEMKTFEILDFISFGFEGVVRYRNGRCMTALVPVTTSAS